MALPEHPIRRMQWTPATDGALAAGLVGGGLIAGAAFAALGVLSDSGWGLLLAAIVTSVINAGIVLGVLALRRGSAVRDALRDQWQRELRHLSAWGSEEGILRKAGLIHDLSTLSTPRLSLGQILLSGADLRGCHLADADLRGADLKGANLQGSVLDGADMTGADLTGANLSLSSLKATLMKGCMLEGANLAKADLAGANLARANLVNANVHGVDLAKTLLDRTRFALREASDFSAEVHPSVEDWIRERLDARGFYNHPGASSARPNEHDADVPAGAESQEI